MKDPDWRERRRGSILSYTGAADAPPPRKAEGEPPVTVAEAEMPETAPAAGGAKPVADPSGWQPFIHPAWVLRGIRTSGRLIAAMTIAGALLGLIIALSMTREYDAQAELLVDPRDVRLVERELVSATLPMDAVLAVIENQMRLMTSSRVIDRVVDELELTADPEFNGRGGGFSLRGLISEMRLLVTGGSDSSLSGEARLHAITVRNLLRKLWVTRSGRNFVVTVTVRSRSPDKAARIANKAVAVFLEESGALMGTVAGRAASELGSRLDELRLGVESAERAVEEFRAANGLIDARGHLIGDDEILALNQRLGEARARTTEAAARARSLESADIDTVLGGGLPEGVTSGAITELRAQYAALTREASRLSASVGPRHPQRRSIDAQLAEASSQIRAELNRIAAAIRLDLERARSQEQALSQRLEELKTRQADVAGDLVTLRDLEREATAQRTVYEAFLIRATETGEQQGLNATNISVISEAKIPLDPSSRSRSSIALAGLLIGLLAGLALAALRGAADGWTGDQLKLSPDPDPLIPPPPSRRTRRWRRASNEEERMRFGGEEPAAEALYPSRGPAHMDTRQVTCATDDPDARAILNDLHAIRSALSELTRTRRSA